MLLQYNLGLGGLGCCYRHCLSITKQLGSAWLESPPSPPCACIENIHSHTLACLSRFQAHPRFVQRSSQGSLGEYMIRTLADLIFGEQKILLKNVSQCCPQTLLTRSDLKALIHLQPLPMCWAYRSVPGHLTSVV